MAPAKHRRRATATAGPSPPRGVAADQRATSSPAAFLAGAFGRSLLRGRLLGRRLPGRGLLGRRPSWPGAFFAGGLRRRWPSAGGLRRRTPSSPRPSSAPPWPGAFFAGAPSSPRPWPAPSSPRGLRRRPPSPEPSSRAPSRPAALLAAALVAAFVVPAALRAVAVVVAATFLAAALAGAVAAAAVRAAALTGAAAAAAAAARGAGGGATGGRCGLRQRARLLDVGLERGAGAEARRLRLRDAHRGARVRVAPGARCALDPVERAEPGDRHLPAPHDLADDGVEHRLQGVVGGPAAAESLLQLLDEICLVHVDPLQVETAPGDARRRCHGRRMPGLTRRYACSGATSTIEAACYPLCHNGFAGAAERLGESHASHQPHGCRPRHATSRHPNALCESGSRLRR